MNELLEKGQEIRIIPQDFRNSNKGRIVEVQDRNFLMEVFHEPSGILINNLIEFYSPTKHGMLYFTTDVTKIENNMLTIKTPIKHRFLQRRAFTRITFTKEIECKLDGKSYKTRGLDLSFGGVKLKTNENFDIDRQYDIFIPILKEETINCKFQPIRIEKNEEGVYTLSGRFTELSDKDRMTLTQFCIRRNIEKVNK